MGLIKLRFVFSESKYHHFNVVIADRTVMIAHNKVIELIAYGKAVKLGIASLFHSRQCIALALVKITQTQCVTEFMLAYVSDLVVIVEPSVRRLNKNKLSGIYAPF
jgi:hypothetical protein